MGQGRRACPSRRHAVGIAPGEAALRRLLLVASVLLVGPGCPGKGESRKDLGQSVGDAASDTRTLSAAQEAVNRVVRAGADCEAVTEVVGAAREAVDQAEAAIRTPAGRTTLTALRRSLERAEQVCP